jgi:hypothetical protein
MGGHYEVTKSAVIGLLLSWSSVRSGAPGARSLLAGYKNGANRYPSHEGRTVGE